MSVKYLKLNTNISLKSTQIGESLSEMILTKPMKHFARSCLKGFSSSKMSAILKNNLAQTARVVLRCAQAITCTWALGDVPHHGRLTEAIEPTDLADLLGAASPLVDDHGPEGVATLEVPAATVAGANSLAAAAEAAPAAASLEAAPVALLLVL